MNKKVLIITYPFSQTINIGFQRLRGLAEYLPEYGWGPLILIAKSNSKQNFKKH